MVGVACRFSRDGCEMCRLSWSLVNHGGVRLRLGRRGCLAGPGDLAQHASQVCRLHANVEVLHAAV